MNRLPMSARKSLVGLILGSAFGLPLLAGGCDGKPETGAQATSELQKARDESAKAAEEFAKEQKEAAKAKRSN